MPKVTCPTCGCWALVLAPKNKAHLFGGDPPKGCSRLRDRIEAGDVIKDLLACEDMSRAVEMAVGGASHAGWRADGDLTSAGPLATWLEAPRSRRRFFRRKTNLTGSISAAGMKRKCAVDDVSPLGALISLQDCEGLETGAYVTFAPEGYQTIPAEVRHVDESEDMAGLMLLHGPAEQAALARWFANHVPSTGSQISDVA